MEDLLYTYKAYVTNIYRADYITVVIELGFDVIYKTKIFLSLISAPDIVGKEKEAGLISRDALREKILNKNIYIKTEKSDSYQGTIYISEPFLSESEGHSNFVNVNKWLIDNKYATYYGTKTYL